MRQQKILVGMYTETNPKGPVSMLGPITASA